MISTKFLSWKRLQCLVVQFRLSPSSAWSHFSKHPVLVSSALLFSGSCLTWRDQTSSPAFLLIFLGRCLKISSNISFGRYKTVDQQKGCKEYMKNMRECGMNLYTPASAILLFGGQSSKCREGRLLWSCSCHHFQRAFTLCVKWVCNGQNYIEIISKSFAFYCLIRMCNAVQIYLVTNCFTTGICNEIKHSNSWNRFIVTYILVWQVWPVCLCWYPALVLHGWQQPSEQHKV